MDNQQSSEPSGSLPPPPPPGAVPPSYPPYYAPPPPEEMGTGKVVGLSALACCIPFIGPVIALIIGIIERAKRGAMVVIVIGGIMLVLSVPILGVYIAVALPLFMFSAPESVQEDIYESVLGDDYSRIKDKAKEAEGKQNLHGIQMELERYAIDRDGIYPTDIEQIFQAGNISEFPENTFSLSPMQVVLLADPPEVREGNFSYIPEITEGKVTGYTLLGYGSINTTESFHPEGSGSAAVVITLSSGLSQDLNSP